MSTNLAGGFLLIVLAVSATAAPPGPPISPQKGSDEDALLRALNFALTATDGDKFAWDDRRNCVAVAKGDNTVPPSGVARPSDYFFLGNVDSSRIRFEKLQKKDQFSVTNWVRIRLHGEEGVHEFRYAPAVYEATPGLKEIKGPNPTDFPFEVQTDEYDRLVRAWKYLYTHGCRSAHSSF